LLDWTRRPVQQPTDSGARIDAALDRVGLPAVAGKRYRATRWDAAAAGDRELAADAARALVLDEPTNGLTRGTREVRHLIGDLAAGGATVLVSSHLLAEVDQMQPRQCHVRGQAGLSGADAELRTGDVKTVRVTDRGR
jgi:ABC-2 type transport system ATP-binding protein